MQRKKLRLIPCKTPEDVHSLLNRLVVECGSGEVAGMCTVVIYKGNEYDLFVAGEVKSNPTFARGALRTLDDYLAKLIIDDA